MNTYIRNAVDTTAFAAIGYGGVKLCQGAIAAVRSGTWFQAASEPLFVQELSSLSAWQVGVSCAVFIAVDTAAKFALDQLLPYDSRSKAVIVARVTVSVLATAAMATLAGVTTAMITAMALIAAAIVTYNYAESTASVFHGNRYA